MIKANKKEKEDKKEKQGENYDHIYCECNSKIKWVSTDIFWAPGHRLYL